MYPRQQYVDVCKVQVEGRQLKQQRLKHLQNEEVCVSRPRLLQPHLLVVWKIEVWEDEEVSGDLLLVA